MLHVTYLILSLLAAMGQNPTSLPGQVPEAPPTALPATIRSQIEIVNSGKYIPVGQITNIDGGPAVGNMLNNHYFPGMNLYNGGRYRDAENEFNFVVARSYALDQNPRKIEYMSTTFYLRGMIYFYHSKGVGRLAMAKEDFENSLKWNPRNYGALLELSRLYTSLGFKEQAVAILHRLLELQPDAVFAKQAQTELDKITGKAPTGN